MLIGDEMRFIAVLLSAGYLLLCQSCGVYAGKHLYGRVEKVTLVQHDVTLATKFDTGAKSASLNASDISTVEEKGKTYLRFHVPNAQSSAWFTAEYVGDIKIKTRVDEKHTLAHKNAPLVRPVVLMEVKIGREQRTIRVNLANRKRFIYPLLFGREAIIAFDGIVDPSVKYTLKNKPR